MEEGRDHSGMVRSRKVVRNLLHYFRKGQSWLGLG